MLFTLYQVSELYDIYIELDITSDLFYVFYMVLGILGDLYGIYFLLDIINDFYGFYIVLYVCIA